MIKKKFLYSAAILASALQVCSVSPSLAMEYPAYDKSGNAVGKVGVKRRGQDVLEFTFKSSQTRDCVSFDAPQIFLKTESHYSTGSQDWKLDVNGQTRTASLDLSKKILLYRSGYYAPSQFGLGGYGYEPGTSITMKFSDGNFIYSVDIPSVVITRENLFNKEKNKNTKLGSLLLDTICPEKMSKKALKKAKKAERIASREASAFASDEERVTRNKQATNAKKALKNHRIRQQKK